MKKRSISTFRIKLHDGDRRKTSVFSRSSHTLFFLIVAFGSVVTYLTARFMHEDPKPVQLYMGVRDGLVVLRKEEDEVYLSDTKVSPVFVWLIICTCEISSYSNVKLSRCIWLTPSWHHIHRIQPLQLQNAWKRNFKRCMCKINLCWSYKNQWFNSSGFGKKASWKQCKWMQYCTVACKGWAMAPGTHGKEAPEESNYKNLILWKCYNYMHLRVVRLLLHTA